jgi:hypothetical protein
MFCIQCYVSCCLFGYVLTEHQVLLLFLIVWFSKWIKQFWGTKTIQIYPTFNLNSNYVKKFTIIMVLLWHEVERSPSPVAVLVAFATCFTRSAPTLFAFSLNLMLLATVTPSLLFSIITWRPWIDQGKELRSVIWKGDQYICWVFLSSLQELNLIQFYCSFLIIELMMMMMMIKAMDTIEKANFQISKQALETLFCKNK